MRKLILLLSLTLGACASYPTEQELAEADYGRVISQAECESIAKKEIEMSLKDPNSAIYKFGKCVKKGVNSIPVLGMDKEYGYYIPVMVNAKNSYGGYVGFEESHILIRDGKVFRKLI